MRRKEIRTCQVPDCVRVHRSKGYCGSHYEQFKRGITPVEKFEPFLEKEVTCILRDCPRPVYSKTLCRSHYGVSNSFKIGPEEMQEIYDSGCGICESRTDIHIDHDHSCCNGNFSCGLCIRGGLCARCNMALGSFRDDADLLRKAVRYLETRRVIE